MKTVGVTMIICVILFAVAVPAMAREIKKNYHEKFDVKKGDRLRLKHGDGDVTIKPWDKDVLDVEIYYRAEVKSVGLTGHYDFYVEFSQSDDVIHVIGKEKHSGGIGIHTKKRFEYTYTIRAPKYLELDLEGEDGDISIEEWEGIINCRLDDGDINLENILSPKTRINFQDGDLRITALQGELLAFGDDGDVILTNCNTSRCQIELADGDVRIKNSEGNFEIETDDGDIMASDLRAQTVDIRSEDGEIELYLLKTEEIDLHVKTDDGNVNIDLEPGISATISIDTDDGRLRMDLPDVKNFREGRHRLSGEIYGGDGRIHLMTNDGNITLKETR